MTNFIKIRAGILLLMIPMFLILGSRDLSAKTVVKFQAQKADQSCSGCSKTNNCIDIPSGNKITTSSFAGNGTLITILLLLTFYLYRSKKLKIYLLGGGTLILLLLGSSYFARIKSSEVAVCNDGFVVDTVVSQLKAVANPAEFKPAGDEFASVGSELASNSKVAINETTTKTKDEFAPVIVEIAPLDNKEALSEFSQADDKTKTTQPTVASGPSDTRFLIELGILFLLVVIIGFAIRYPEIWNFRGLVLMATLVYFGFYKGGCPCMISSFQNTILALIGTDVSLISMLWFLGLIPLTYLFGKIWCGWVCHLGALQEFIFLPAKFNFLHSVNSQRNLRYLRGALLIILLVQLMITHTNIFIHYDPLKVAFNLFSANTTGYVLLVILLVSSVLIYRPFCRGVCPVGLILGWIALLPGAKRLSKDQTCIDCNSCSKPCKSHAMIYENKKSSLQIQDCILCGDCLGSCKKNSILINRAKI